VRFQKRGLAFQVLSDDKLREDYNANGKDGVDNNMTCRTLLDVVLQPFSYVGWSVFIYILEQALVKRLVERYEKYKMPSTSSQSTETTKNPITAGDSLSQPNVFAVESAAEEKSKATGDMAKNHNRFLRLVFKEPFLFANMLYVVATVVYLLAYVVQLDSGRYSVWDKYQIYCLRCTNSTVLMFCVAATMRRYNIAEVADVDAMQLANIFNRVEDLAVNRPELTLPTTLAVICAAPFILTHSIPGVILYCWYVAMYLAAIFVYMMVLPFCCHVGGLVSGGRDAESGLTENQKGWIQRSISVFAVRTVWLLIIQSSVSLSVLFYQGQYGYVQIISEEAGIRREGCFYDNKLDTAANAFTFFSFL
jgi:hypothetical protein